jgi:methionyl aminopeptidase
MGVHSTQALETPRRSPREERHGAIALRSSDDMAAIERAGAAVAAALELAEGAVRAGATTLDVDAAVRTALAAAGAEPAFVNYPHPTGGPAFPAAACVSVGNEVVHGVPGARTLRAGDVVSIDVGARVGGWCADAAVTVTVPGAGDAAALAAFVADAWETLHAGIALMQPGQRWSDVADRMQRVAFGRGHGMVEGWHGHGIGRSFHEAPQAPSIVTAGLRADRDFTLLPGMVLAVEPILVMGARGTVGPDGCATSVPAEVSGDGWTVRVADGLVAAHVEHTVAVTRGGPRILTRRTRAATRETPTDGGRSLAG